MKGVISYYNFSVLTTACTSTCKDISSFSLAIQAFLQFLKFQLQKNAAFNKHDMLKFCNEWKKNLDKLKIVTEVRNMK